MINLVNNKLKGNDNKSKIISIECLQNLKMDIKKMEKDNLENVFLKGILRNYKFILPDLGFNIKSIIIIASPSPIIKIGFNLNGKKIKLIMPPTYIDMYSKPVILEKYLNSILKPKGFSSKYTNDIPQKLLFVRSGLGFYGKNNICYTKGMGSFFRIYTYYSDIPSNKLSWYEISEPELCKKCRICLNNCPTKAIAKEKFLINADKCLTRFNESDIDEFPLWIDNSFHNSVIGCFKCQIYCPNNKDYLKNIIEPVEFSEKETLFLLEGAAFNNYSKEIIIKLQKLGMQEYINIISRNLNVLIKNL